MKRYRLSQPHAHCLVLSRDTGSGRFFGVLLLVLAGLFCLIWGGDWLAAIETVQLPGPLAVAMLGMALAFGLLGVQLVAGRGFRADATAFLLDNQRAVLEVQHTHRGHTDSHAIPYAQIAAFVVRRTRRRSQNSQNTTRKVYYVYATAVVLQDGSVLDLNNFGTRPEPAARLAEQLTQHQQAAGPVATHAARATAHTPPAGVQLSGQAWPRELRWHNSLWQALAYTVPLLLAVALIVGGIVLQAGQIGPPGDNTSLYVAIGFFTVFLAILGFILSQTAFRQVGRTYALQLSREAVVLGWYRLGQFVATRRLPLADVMAACVYSYHGQQAQHEQLLLCTHRGLAAATIALDSPEVTAAVGTLHPAVAQALQQLEGQSALQKGWTLVRGSRQDRIICHLARATVVQRLQLAAWLNAHIAQAR